MNGTGNKVAPEIDTPGGDGNDVTRVAGLDVPVTPANSMAQTSLKGSLKGSPVDRGGSVTWMQGMADFGARVSGTLRRADSIKSEPAANAGSLDLIMLSRIKVRRPSGTGRCATLVSQQLPGRHTRCS